MFNDWLLLQLQERDWSQADLARATGLTTAAISKYMQGRIPDKDSLNKIAHALKLPPKLVFEKAGVIPPETELDETKRELLHSSEGLPKSDIELAIQILNARQDYYANNPAARTAAKK
jgi:transcriptional regulator with XRE-family HTH domain